MTDPLTQQREKEIKAYTEVFITLGKQMAEAATAAEAGSVDPHVLADALKSSSRLMLDLMASLCRAETECAMYRHTLAELNQGGSVHQYGVH
jgi:hypothetical protein